MNDGSLGPLSTSRYPLPSLRPPTEGLIALLNIPPTAKLHVPTTIHLTIRNHHPTRSAVVSVHLEPDPVAGDASGQTFAVAGPRSACVPVLLPGGGEETVVWRLVPMVCGRVEVPRVRVVERRRVTVGAGERAEGAVEGVEGAGDGVRVRVVDVGREERGEGERGGGSGEEGCVVLVVP
jgi:hypothetical protein